MSLRPGQRQQERSTFVKSILSIAAIASVAFVGHASAAIHVTTRAAPATPLNSGVPNNGGTGV